MRLLIPSPFVVGNRMWTAEILGGAGSGMGYSRANGGLQACFLALRFRRGFFTLFSDCVADVT
jgi:hypothetical protein